MRAHLVGDIVPVPNERKGGSVGIQLPHRADELVGQVVGAGPLTLQRPANAHEVVDWWAAATATTADDDDYDGGGIGDSSGSGSGSGSGGSGGSTRGGCCAGCPSVCAHLVGDILSVPTGRKGGSAKYEDAYVRVAIISMLEYTCPRWYEYSSTVALLLQDALRWHY